MIGCSGHHMCPKGINGRMEEGKIAVFKRQPYHCFFTDVPIKIDGLLDEQDWKKAKVLDFILPVTFQEPISKTEARVLYDNHYLYIGFKAYDKDIWATYIERDMLLCREDVLEVFLKVVLDKDPYYEFEFSPLGTIFDAFFGKRGAGGATRWTKWNCEGLCVATRVKGTLNNWRDEDEYWTLEVAIPFADLSIPSGIPREGDTWLFHLARYDYSVYLPKGNEITSCTLLSKVNFHLYEEWLELIFMRKSEP